MPELPPWIKGEDIAGEYARGLQLGASIGQERARLAQESQRMQMEIAAREETTRREMAMATQRLAQEKALKEQEIGVRQAKLAQADKFNAARTAAAAQVFAARQGFAKARSEGKSTEQALYENPNLDPAFLRDYTLNEKDARDFAEKVRHNKATEAKPGAQSVGTMDLPVDPKDFTKGTMRLPIYSPIINQNLGTNAPPGTGTNFVARPGMPSNEVAAVATPPLPLPKSKNQLKVGAPYLTQHGVYTWNGKKLVKQADETNGTGGSNME